MREVILVEGVQTNAAMDIIPGALTIQDEMVSIMLNGNFNSIIGRAWGFQRDRSTGELSMEIEIFEQWANTKWAYSFYITDFMTHKPADRVEVISGIIRAVSATHEDMGLAGKSSRITTPHLRKEP